MQIARSEDFEDLEEWEVGDFTGWLGDWSADAFDLEAAKAEFDAKHAGQVEYIRKRRIESRPCYRE